MTIIPRAAACPQSPPSAAVGADAVELEWLALAIAFNVFHEDSL